MEIQKEKKKKLRIMYLHRIAVDVFVQLPENVLYMNYTRVWQHSYKYRYFLYSRMVT